MPAADCLLDSNILIYALSGASDERQKRQTAADLISRENFGTSYQVIMETWVVATRKMTIPINPGRAAAFLEAMLAFPCVPGSASLYRQAILLASRYDIHPYDGAILAAAQELGAEVVYSEDMSHGQLYDGVRVVNPFRA
jgi:predicted nucleic acid-binding protein